ncbi:hypothetical protein JST97_13870 [bacterium]|nr:hypothetical protein [bacterium]
MEKDLKLLFGRSAFLCGWPGCGKSCCTPDKARDSATLTGQIAHIHAKNTNGPRFNPLLDPKQVDRYDNLIWMCTEHHPIIDNKHNELKYPADLLRSWKADLEASVRKRVAEMDVPEEVRTLLDLMVKDKGVSEPFPDYSLLAVNDKLKKNSFSPETQQEISHALSRVNQVHKFVVGIEALSAGWADSLVQVFRAEYQRLREQSSNPDELYVELRLFAARGRQEIKFLAAASQVVVYLFERCEVFEK